jgi:uncharacterized protein GlcG (DUF336 family)
MSVSTLIRHFGCIGLVCVGVQAGANDTVETRLMTLPLASDIARAAVDACAKSGYQVSAVVVDRSGSPQVVMRDVYASRFTIEIAERKANAVVLSGVSSSEFRRNRADIVAEMNEVDGVLVMAGAVPVRAAGALLGAVGVSGAPGGDKDEACARAGVESVQERLDFAGD